MPDTTLYHVERLTKVTIKAYGPDVLKEHDDEAWVRLDSFESEKSHYYVFDWWWQNRIADEDKTAGRYRLVEETQYGGHFSGYEAKPSWQIVEVKRDAVAA